MALCNLRIVLRGRGTLHCLRTVLLQADAGNADYYAVTNRRVLVLVIMFGRHLVVGYIRDVQSIETSFNCDGSGTIRFGNSPWWSGSLDNSEMDPFEMSRSSAVPVFLDISNAREAYRIVNEAKDAPS